MDHALDKIKEARALLLGAYDDIYNRRLDDARFDELTEPINAALRAVNAVYEVLAADERRGRIKRSLDIKLKIVRADGSKIFKNWRERAGVGMEDFLDALRWLCGDPLDEHGRLTRELGCDLRAGLVRLARGYGADGGCAFYREHDGSLWIGSPDRESISAEDNV